MTDISTIITAVEAIVVAVEVSKTVVGFWGRPLEQRQLKKAYSLAFTHFFDSYSPGDHTLVVDPNFFARAKVVHQMAKLSAGERWDMDVMDTQFRIYSPEGNIDDFHNNVYRLHSFFADELSGILSLDSKIILQYVEKTTNQVLDQLQSVGSIIQADLKLKEEFVASVEKLDLESHVMNGELSSDQLRSKLIQSAVVVVPMLIDNLIYSTLSFNDLRDEIFSLLNALELPVETRYKIAAVIDFDAIDKAYKESLRSMYDMDSVQRSMAKILIECIDIELLTARLRDDRRNLPSGQKLGSRAIESALTASADMSRLNVGLNEAARSGMPSMDEFGSLTSVIFRDEFLAAVRRVDSNC